MSSKAEEILLRGAENDLNQTFGRRSHDHLSLQKFSSSPKKQEQKNSLTEIDLQNSGLSVPRNENQSLLVDESLKEQLNSSKIIIEYRFYHQAVRAFSI
jgi:hypothetical protein